MIDFNNPFSIIAEEKSGGLFDFDATAPVMALQFLILAILLDKILYKPISNIIERREKYISKNLNKAKEMINEADQLVSLYQRQLERTKKQSEQCCENFDKLYKNTTEVDKNIIEVSVINCVDKALVGFAIEKQELLDELEKSREIITQNIVKKFST